MDNIAARTEPPAQLDEFCDSEFEPLDRDPEVVDEMCREAVERHPFVAIGHRPEDHFVHDLLCRRLLRENRLYRTQQALADPADWILDRVRSLPGAKGHPHARGIQLTVLDYYHRRQLYLARDWVLAGERDVSPPSWLRRWQRLWDCPPYGAQYDRCRAHYCGMPQLCPWCRARLGARWLRQLRKRRRRRAPDPRLMLLRTHITTEEIGPEPVGYFEPDELSQALRDERDLIELSPPDGGIYLPQSEDIYAELTDWQMWAARCELFDQLDKWLVLLGTPAVDRCLVTTVEPAVWRDRNGVQWRQHRFCGYLLAPVPDRITNPDRWRELEHARLELSDYPADAVPVLTVGSARSLITEVLAWPAVGLWDEWQWWRYHAQTWRRRLYVTSGAWRKLLAKPAPVNPVRSPPTSPRLLALERGTRRRQYARDANHRELLKIAKPIWAALLAELRPPTRGRPPYRRLLVERLAAQGVMISGRPLRQLMAALTTTWE